MKNRDRWKYSPCEHSSLISPAVNCLYSTQKGGSFFHTANAAYEFRSRQISPRNTPCRVSAHARRANSSSMRKKSAAPVARDRMAASLPTSHRCSCRHQSVIASAGNRNSSRLPKHPADRAESCPGRTLRRKRHRNNWPIERLHTRQISPVIVCGRSSNRLHSPSRSTQYPVCRRWIFAQLLRRAVEKLPWLPSACA